MSEHFIDQRGIVVTLERGQGVVACQGCVYAAKNQVWQCRAKEFGPLDGECTLDEIFVEVKHE